MTESEARAPASVAESEQTIRRGREVISIEASGLQELEESLDESFVRAVDLLLHAPGRVVVTGIGKSGHISRKIVATLSATGTPAIFVHPAEASHGDLGMLVGSDVLVIISNSGETPELHSITNYAQQHGLPIIAIASRADSFIMRNATVCIQLPRVREACLANIAPTTSTTIQLALGDALAMAVMDRRGFSRDGMKALHPGGSIGRRLATVGEVMHGKNFLPLVSPETAVDVVISKMTSMGFGIAGIVDAKGQLQGVITDGDLRRNFNRLTSVRAEEIMTAYPKRLTTDMLAEDAMQFLNKSKITAAFVIQGDDLEPVGIVHLHDFLRLGL